MAQILCRNPSTGVVGWRAVGSTPGFQKMRRDGSAVGWRLPEDPGTYLHRDGTQVGWRNTTLRLEWEIYSGRLGRTGGNGLGHHLPVQHHPHMEIQLDSIRYNPVPFNHVYSGVGVIVWGGFIIPNWATHVNFDWNRSPTSFGRLHFITASGTHTIQISNTGGHLNNTPLSFPLPVTGAVSQLRYENLWTQTTGSIWWETYRIWLDRGAWVPPSLGNTTITFNLNGGQIGNNWNNVDRVFALGRPFGFANIPAPQNTGLTLQGWQLAPWGSGSTLTRARLSQEWVTGPQTYIAVWAN